MTCKKITVALTVLVLCLCTPAFGEILYTVTNLNSSGAGSFAAALASAESDGQDSRIEFSVGGTIYQSSRYNITAGNCTICGTEAPSPGITFDFNSASEGFRVTSDNVRFCNIKVVNTAVNCDGITLDGNNGVVERCTFDYCRDEAVGITDYFVSGSGRGNVVAFCRIEHCGSQPDDGTNYANGRGILVTEGASATIVGNYVYYCCRGITVNTAPGFADMRHNRVDNSLSPASGHGITITGSGVQGNMIDCSANNNALCGFRPKSACTFYRSGLSGSGNPNGLISIDGDTTEVGSPITVEDTPFPSWLSGASTPTQANDVGMGTGDCQCYAGGVTKATNPNPSNGSTSVAVNADLSWTAGTGATSHDVYFGTSSSSPTFRGNQTGTTYDTGTMANNTTYYWRIDEVGDQTITGDLWHFTTVSGGGGSSGTYYSLDTKDGTVIESSETSGVGGTYKTTYSYVGDAASDKQQITILHFDTSAIPDGATITSATLSIRRLGKGGDPTNPSLGTITVDIKNGYYGTSDALAASDFEAASSATNVTTIPYPTSNGQWVSGDLNSSGRSNINKTGVTQFKIRFTLDDNDDGSADYLNIYDNGDPPQLEVTWQ
jgi:hypothetical protein